MISLLFYLNQPRPCSWYLCDLSNSVYCYWIFITHDTFICIMLILILYMQIHLIITYYNNIAHALHFAHIWMHVLSNMYYILYLLNNGIIYSHNCYICYAIDCATSSQCHHTQLSYESDFSMYNLLSIWHLDLTITNLLSQAK